MDPQPPFLVEGGSWRGRVAPGDTLSGVAQSSVVYMKHSRPDSEKTRLDPWRRFGPSIHASVVPLPGIVPGPNHKEVSMLVREACCGGIGDSLHSSSSEG